jgi:hypothetical protein
MKPSEEIAQFIEDAAELASEELSGDGFAFVLVK